MIDPAICGPCGAAALPQAEHPDDQRLRCPVCGATRVLVRQPLLCLTGASGTGKSTVAGLVAPAVADVVVCLEQDVLWRAELADRPGGVAEFRATWLRLAAMIGQSGRPVLLCGTVVPAELEHLPERVLFESVHYLALHAPTDELVHRLRRRPRWRGWDEARITEMLVFADGLARGAPTMQPPVALLDTTGRRPEELAAEVVAWVHATLGFRRS